LSGVGRCSAVGVWGLGGKFQSMAVLS
jgi:hypothetical protein